MVKSIESYASDSIEKLKTMKNIINYICISCKYVTFYLALFSCFSLFGQTNNEIVSGKVIDENGNPLQNVQVTIQESTITTLSDENGEFSIVVQPGSKLTFTLNGYETVSKTISKNETQIKITLNGLIFGTTESDDVPVAYSYRKKRYITGAVSTASYEDFGKRKDMNTMNGLGGLVNGLTVLASPWSDVGYDPSFYIRGLKTTNSNNAPLILVDDVERKFSQLNANEIESISVLKDAAALAIYGNRGANGVILVRTKRGNKNKRDIIINSEVGLAESLRLPKFLNAYDYARLYNQVQIMDGVLPANVEYSDADIQGYKDVVEGVPGADPYRYPNVDFYSEFLKPVVKQQQHDLTMIGGNNLARYFVLLGYMSQEGLYRYGDNNFERYNFRTNVDVDLSKSLAVSLDMAGRIENLETPGGNYAYAIFGQFANTPSNAYPIFNENGTLGGTSNYTSNPYGLMNEMGQRDLSYRYFNADLNFKLDLSQFVKGLSWQGKGGIDFVDGATSQLTSSQFAVYELLDDSSYTSNGTQDEVKTKNFWYNDKDRQFTFNSSFKYDRTYGNNNINAIGLFYLRQLNSMGISVPFKTIGVVSQVGYRYQDKYMIDGVLSYTGSENFAKGHRFGLFYAISGGWIMSEESFLKNNSSISFLKIRVSHGTTGLDKPLDDRFLFRENWGEVNGYSFGTGGTYRVGTDQVRTGNENLKWETSVKSNLGIDIGLFDNQVFWTVDGFYDHRKDILVRKYATTPAMAGIPLPYENSGETKSWGFDSEISFDKQVNSSWQLVVKGNIMLTHSNIIDIDETFKLDEYQYQKGNPIGQPFGYVSNGFFTEEEINRRAEGNFTAEEIEMGYDIMQNGGNLRPGDIKYKDLNDDNKIDGKDTRPIAGSHVPTLSGGVTLFTRYKIFDLSVQFVGMGGRYIYMPDAYRNNFNSNGNASVYAFDAWTPENANSAAYPRLSINNNSNNQEYSDFWFLDGSFIRLKTVELGLSVPDAIIKVIGISKMRLYVNGFNLLCFDKVKDFDPENTNAALSSYPFQRIATLGINVTF